MVIGEQLGLRFRSVWKPLLERFGDSRVQLLANAGNAIHSVYVFSLPPGPLWALHSFYLTTTAAMLVWYFRYADRTASNDTVAAPVSRAVPVGAGQR